LKVERDKGKRKDKSHDTDPGCSRYAGTQRLYQGQSQKAVESAAGLSVGDTRTRGTHDDDGSTASWMTCGMMEADDASRGRMDDDD
jgi:hypothetical protein